MAIDRSLTALAEAREAVPGATFIESDLRAPLPIDAGQVGAIVASLSLHYFDWRTTRQLVEQLRVCLTPNRPLICRVNSTRQVYCGSTGHPSIKPGYFRVGDTTKRFFDRAELLKLFADRWHIVSSVCPHSLLGLFSDDPELPGSVVAGSQSLDRVALFWILRARLQRTPSISRPPAGSTARAGSTS